MYDAIVLGDSCQDVFLQIGEDDAKVFCELKKDECTISFNFADKIPVTAKFDAVGGNAANAAVSLARLGLHTALYTHIGSDRTGDRVSGELQENGIALEYVVREEGERTNYNTVLSYDGERTIFAFHHHRQYLLPDLQPASWLYVTSMKDGFEHVIPAILRYVEDHGVKVVYQPGTFQLKMGLEASRSLLAKTHMVVMNKEEAETFLGHEGKLAHDIPTIPALLQELRELGPELAIITDGGRGSYAADSTGAVHLPVIDHILRVDTTGAGDAYASATTAALMHGLQLAEALRWGQMQAASVVQHVGAQAGLLRQHELELWLRDHPEIHTQPV